MSGNLMNVTIIPEICAPTNKKIIRMIVDSGREYCGNIEQAIVHKTRTVNKIAKGCEMVGQFLTIVLQLAKMKI